MRRTLLVSTLLEEFDIDFLAGDSNSVSNVSVVAHAHCLEGPFGELGIFKDNICCV